MNYYGIIFEHLQIKKVQRRGFFTFLNAESIDIVYVLIRTIKL